MRFIPVNADRIEEVPIEPSRLYFRTKVSGCIVQWQVSLDNGEWETLFEIGSETGRCYAFNNRSSGLGKLLALDEDGRIKMTET